MLAQHTRAHAQQASAHTASACSCSPALWGCLEQAAAPGAAGHPCGAGGRAGSCTPRPPCDHNSRAHVAVCRGGRRATAPQCCSAAVLQCYSAASRMPSGPQCGVPQCGVPHAAVPQCGVLPGRLQPHSAKVQHSCGALSGRPQRWVPPCHSGAHAASRCQGGHNAGCPRATAARMPRHAVRAATVPRCHCVPCAVRAAAAPPVPVSGWPSCGAGHSAAVQQRRGAIVCRVWVGRVPPSPPHADRVA